MSADVNKTNHGLFYFFSCLISIPKCFTLYLKIQTTKHLTTKRIQKPAGLKWKKRRKNMKNKASQQRGKKMEEWELIKTKSICQHENDKKGEKLKWKQEGRLFPCNVNCTHAHRHRHTHTHTHTPHTKKKTKQRENNWLHIEKQSLRCRSTDEQWESEEVWWK